MAREPRIPYPLVRSDRKTIGIEIKRDGTVIVRAPYRMSAKAIERFVDEKADWIEKTLQKVASCPTLPPMTDEEKQALIERAKTVIPARVEEIAATMGIEYGRVTIRCQRTRWGSCSVKGNLNFNALLAGMPSGIMDYVIVHELCHRRQLNHSARFWALVASVMPDYRERERWLKDHGASLMSRW